MVKLVNDATALLSMRNSDFDANSAYGEVVDNSIQANANNIKIMIAEKLTGGRRNSYVPITDVCFGDDGSGMEPDVLQRCMQLGYSTRYNDRTGIGRFGVGMTLAAINQCKRVEIYSRVQGGAWYWTYVDIDEVTADPPEMEGLPEPRQKDFPVDLSRLVGSESGTLVIWKNYDRQSATASEVKEDARIWLGRTYRKFIWNDLHIELDGSVIHAIDPLYVTVDKTAFPDDSPGHEYNQIKFKWPVDKIDHPTGDADEAPIVIRMSLVNEARRPYRGCGNSLQVHERFIDKNEGISILRNDREVFYGHIPYWPGKQFQEIDRFWGCEISFGAELDRAFTVKNIKRGAIPCKELKKTIKEKISPTRETAVEKVQDYWGVVDEEKKKKAVAAEKEGVLTGHEAAEDVAKATPTDRGDLDKDKNKAEEVKSLVDLIKKNETEQLKAAWIARFESQPFTIEDDSWKGPDFIDISHLGGSDVIRYNMRHAFFRALSKIVDDLEAQGNEISQAKKLKSLIDILLISYSKAEAKFDNKLVWDDLESFLENHRQNWGQYLANYIETWLREQGEE